MKIDDKTLASVVGPGKGDAAASSKKFGVDAGAKGDTVELSRNVERFAKANEALQKLPDIRVERVETLKAQIASGEYQVKASDVAEKMLMTMKKGVAV
ncbi:flagellar biosynthesis anti-sigma factor FlgM [Geobacter pickeringii]|uniref:Negative regulator of flagellin synthesis n=1 Tax=Geobacter pickeringii TaxID=345632 RepID=A0A0B5BLG6_9BACT|nr:flagellar biosynthesis anti-sigma factor FlgM [Geobacter pickeringii]AJE04891.1 flagellar biosynthesis anti-sigma factor FlgM [Geobacter pickeringii]